MVHASHDGAWKPVADHVPAAQGCAGTHVRFAVMKLKPDEQKHVDWPVSVPATTLPVPAAGHCVHPSAVVVTVVEVVFEYVFAGQAVQTLFEYCEQAPVRTVPAAHEAAPVQAVQAPAVGVEGSQ